MLNEGYHYKNNSTYDTATLISHTFYFLKIRNIKNTDLLVQLFHVTYINILCLEHSLYFLGAYQVNKSPATHMHLFNENEWYAFVALYVKETWVPEGNPPVGIGDHMPISHAYTWFQMWVAGVRGKCIITVLVRQPFCLTFITDSNNDFYKCIYLNEDLNQLYAVEKRSSYKTDQICIFDLHDNGSCITIETVPCYIRTIEFVGNNR